MNKLILLFAFFIFSMFISSAFSAEGNVYSIGSYNMGTAGVESEGDSYSLRNTLEEGQSSEASAESDSFLLNLGWFEELNITVQESTEEVSTTGGGSGGGGGSSTSSQIQFDADILDFDSPAKLGDFFNFTYFIKGVGSINHDVTVDYWIEKDDEIVTFSSAMFYMGTNEKVVKNGLLFLPEDISSGIYTLVVQANYKGVVGEAHKAIELIVKDDGVEIKQVFVISMYLESSVIEDSDDLTAVIIFENFGNVETKINLTYSIFNDEEKKVYLEKGNVTIQTEKVLRKSFSGLDLENGRYTFVLETLYGKNIYDKFEYDFDVKKNNFWLYILLGIIFLIIIFLVILLVKRRKKKKFKEAKKRILKHYRISKRRLKRWSEKMFL